MLSRPYFNFYVFSLIVSYVKYYTITLSNAVSNHISIILRYSAIDVVRIDLLMRIALKMHVNDDRLSKRKI